MGGEGGGRGSDAIQQGVQTLPCSGSQSNPPHCSQSPMGIQILGELLGPMLARLSFSLLLGFHLAAKKSNWPLCRVFYTLMVMRDLHKTLKSLVHVQSLSLSFLSEEVTCGLGEQERERVRTTGPDQKAH